MLRAVTFDFWNTLYVDIRGEDRDQRRAELLREALAPLDLKPSPGALDDALKAGFDHFDAVWLHEHRTPVCGEIVDAILAFLRAPLPEDVRARLVNDYEQVLLESPPEPMPGAVYTLPQLAERYHLAVICDTGYSPGSVLRRLLQRDGLLCYFEYLFFSNEHGMSKPDVCVFGHTLAELGVPAPEAAHVGDIQRTDIAGAQAAGMSAVHFVGANNSDVERSTGDLLVRHFEDLPSALGGLTCAGC
jgi:HAD superfamily hydrolase (TIGR01549 family)